MKECPKCGTVYTDKTLSFCLSDGSVLMDGQTGAKTEVLPNGLVAPTAETIASTETQTSNFDTDKNIVNSVESPKGAGVSPFWLLSTFALLGIVLAGGIVAWVLYSQSGVKTNSQSGKNVSVAKTSNTTTNNNQSEMSGSGELNTQVNASKPTPIKTATPSSNTFTVVGVKSNDVLYVRPKAGNLKKVVGKIPPGASGIRIVGKGKRVGKSIWVPIIYKGKRGWVNRRFLRKE